MRKNYLVLLATILITAGSFAQKGTTFIGAGGDLLLPTGFAADYLKTGIGFYAKGLFGVGTAARLRLPADMQDLRQQFQQKLLQHQADLFLCCLVIVTTSMGSLLNLRLDMPFLA